MDFLLSLIVFIVGLAAGFIAARVIERKWPNTDRALDVVIDKLGDHAELAVRRARQKRGT